MHYKNILALPNLSRRTHILPRSSKCWEPGKADPNVFPGMGALRAGGRFPNGCSSFSPIATSTSIFLITAISKQPLATSPAWGSGEAEPLQHLVKNLSPTSAGWVCMFLKVPGSSGHFPPQLPFLRGRHHRLGDICKSVCNVSLCQKEWEQERFQ